MKYCLFFSTGSDQMVEISKDGGFCIYVQLRSVSCKTLEDRMFNGDKKFEL